MRTELEIDLKPPVRQFPEGGLYRIYIKRPMDIVLSILAILGLSPILLIVAVLVKLQLGGPVIFTQKRPGLHENIFTLYKFRTMTDKKDDSGMSLSDEMRMTGFGEFLRATSLDELPELFNILRGDMSVIGPRPLLIQYLPLYSERQKRRHEVRPGLSGLAQVKGRNAIGWEEKFDLDIQYVDHITFVGDWKIILLTLKKAFCREGIHSDTAATMEPFTGTMKKE